MARIKFNPLYRPTPNDLANGERVACTLPHFFDWGRMMVGVRAYIPHDVGDHATLRQSAKRVDRVRLSVISVRYPSGTPAGTLVVTTAPTIPQPKYLQRAEAEGYTLDEESVTF